MNPTERQIDFLTSLLVEVYGSEEAGKRLEEARKDWTRSLVSQWIDALVQIRRRPSMDSVPERIHYLDGTVYKVQRAVHGSGRLYAKRLDPETQSFVYAGRGPLSKLSAATVMTREQAAEYGRVYGVCARCGATLTDEESIERGIGPVCVQKF